MPTTKMEVIRKKHSKIVTALITISKHTGRTYEPMTSHQFQLEIQNLNRIKMICTRVLRTARTGQDLLPSTGPYSYYYRLFDGFF
jgi:hypothetical protein